MSERKIKVKEETKLWLEQAKEHWEDSQWLLEGRRILRRFIYG